MQSLSEPLCFRDLLRFDIDGTVSVTYPVLMRYAFYNAMRDCSVFFSCQHGQEARPYVRFYEADHPLTNLLWVVWNLTLQARILDCKRGIV